MTTLYQPGQHHDSSLAHADDAKTFSEVTREAGDAMIRAAHVLPNSGEADLAEATAMFHSAYAEAQLHASLSAAAACRDMAAAVRELTTEVDALRRLLP